MQGCFFFFFVIKFPIMPHKSLEMFILRNVLGVFKTDCTLILNKRALCNNYDLYLQTYTAADISLNQCDFGHKGDFGQFFNARNIIFVHKIP